MDAMKEALKRKKAKLIEMLDMIDEKDLAMPDDGSEDKENKDLEKMGLAPEIEEKESPEMEIELEVKKEGMPEEDDEEKMMASQLYEDGDELKPGFFGKAAQKMKKVLGK